MTGRQPPPRLLLIPERAPKRSRWRAARRAAALLVAAAAFLATGGLGAAATGVAHSAGLGGALIDMCPPIESTTLVSAAWPGAAFGPGSVITGPGAAANAPGALSTALTAASDPYGTGVWSPYPDYAGPGAGRSVTAYEWWGTAGLEFKAFNVEELEPAADCGWTAIPWMALNSVANLMWQFALTFGSIVILLYTLTTTPSLISALLQPLQTILTSVKDDLYLPFLTPMVVLAALWIAWNGLIRRRTTESIQAVAWVLGAAIVSIIFLQSPMWFVDRLNGAIGYVQTGILDAVGNASLAAGVGAGAPTALCYAGSPTGAPEYTVPLEATPVTPTAPPGSVPAPAPTAPVLANPNLGQAAVYAGSVNNRQMQCLIWQVFLFEPWKNGQFGLLADVDVGDGDGGRAFTLTDGTSVTLPEVTVNGRQVDGGNSAALAYLDAAAINHDEVTGAAGEAGTPIDANAKSARLMALIKWMQQEYVSGTTDTANPGFAGVANFVGSNGSNQIGMAILAIVGVLAGGVPIVVLSSKLLFYQLMTVLMLLLSPLYLLAGIHPGFGRSIALGWLEYLINLSIKRIGVTFLMAVLLLIIQIVMTT